MIVNLALAALSAALLTAAFPEFGVSWLAPLALTPLIVAAGREPRVLYRVALGELAGVVYWFGVCHWIRDVLVMHGGMGDALSWLAIALFCVAKAAHMAFFAALACPLLHLRIWAVPAIAALWAGLERTHGPLGFAWLVLGNAGIDMGVPMRVAPFLGVYGVSFVFAAIAACVALLVQRRPRREFAWLLALPLLYLLPALPDAAPGRESAVTLQPNLEQLYPIPEPALRKLHGDMARATLESALDPKLPPPAFLMWPEVPAPFYYYHDPLFRDDVTKVAQLARKPFLFGAVAFTPEQNPLNSAVLLDAQGRPVSRYDKMFLVPFGEFIPPLFSWVNRITKEAGDFEPGKRVVVPAIDGHRLGAFICYESAFPHLVRHFANDGGDVLINLTNDGYFGDSAAREQHLLLARMRAAENRRWVLRSTNNGITVSIDPAGRVVDRMAPFVSQAGRLSFSWISDKTPYTRYGDWFAWWCLLMGLAASACAVWIGHRAWKRSRELAAQ